MARCPVLLQRVRQLQHDLNRLQLDAVPSLHVVFRVFRFDLQSSCHVAVVCSSFGTPTVPVKQLIKELQSLFESKDVKARDKVKEIVVSCNAVPGAFHCSAGCAYVFVTAVNGP